MLSLHSALSPRTAFLLLCGLTCTACLPLKDAADQVRLGQVDGPPGGNDGGLDGSADGGPVGCMDPGGFGGLGCSRCEATDTVSLENACSDVSCTPFDDRLRLGKLGADGTLPALPQLEASLKAAAQIDADAGSESDAGAPPPPPSAPACADVTSSGKVVYVTGSSAAGPFLAKVAQQFATQGTFLVYTSTGSCVGVDAIVNGTPMKTGAAPAPAATATFWSSAASMGEPCLLPTEGVIADLGISDVFAQTCTGFELTNLETLKIRDAHGPIQTMAFVVPPNSPHGEISAQAAYFVYGFGKDGSVLDAAGKAPIWDDETQILQRKASSGTQAMLAAAIGVPPTRWRGKPHASSDDVYASLRAAESDAALASKTIGILAADYIDGKVSRAQVRMLAFRDSHQTCAVYPDSNDTAKDRRNVRDGHYPLWGPMHLLHRVDDNQLPANPMTRQQISDVIGYLSGTKALPNGIKLIDLYASSGLVPECAMHVTRSMDGGNITPSRPQSPCSCLFEIRATGSTDCAECKVQGDCPSGTTCSQGYCEP
ncbi:MAG: hypothetical protein QM778_16065 [Myxococcales bacterium]